MNIFLEYFPKDEAGEIENKKVGAEQEGRKAVVEKLETCVSFRAVVGERVR